MRYSLVIISLAFALPASLTQAAETQNLLDIYQQALNRDPAWASARSGNLAAQEKLEQGKALYRPTVTVNSNASHSETDIKYNGAGSIFRNGGRESFDSYGYGVNVSQPIYRKQISTQYEQAKSQVTQADKQLALAQQQLMLRTAQAYFDVLLAQDKIDLINAQKAAINRQFEQAKANFDVGTATITDVNEAQARYDLTLAQEIAAINDLEVKKRAVQSIIGDLPQRLATAKTEIKPSMPEQGDMEAWVEIAEQNSLALSIQQQALEIATQEVERQNAGHLPTFDAVGGYTDNRANGGPNGFGSDLQNATIGVQLQIPIYQGGLINSRVREAVANKQKAMDDVEVARRQADLDTRQAYLNLASSVAQVKAYEQALTSSQSQLDSTNLGYEVGIRTSVDVLNAQQQYYSAKRDLLQARYTYLLSTLKLKSATGLLNEADMASINQQLASSN
ncbi:MAG TPA: TolC family outer membrane protein [Methylophilaceae bacterium]|nr:TolC family outer membrane protein [Methylophilaceae bacterium]